MEIFLDYVTKPIYFDNKFFVKEWKCCHESLCSWLLKKFCSSSAMSSFSSRKFKFVINVYQLCTCLFTNVVSKKSRKLMKRSAEHIFVRSFLSKAERNYTLRQKVYSPVQNLVESRSQCGLNFLWFLQRWRFSELTESKVITFIKMAACVQRKKTKADYKGEKKELTVCVVCRSRILTVKYLRLRISDIRLRSWDMVRRTLDVGHQTLDILNRALDIGHQWSDVGHCTSDIRHRTSNIKHRTSDVGHLTTDICHRTWDVGHHTSDIRYQASDIGRRTLDVGHRTSVIGHQRSNVGHRTSEGKVLWGIIC